MHESVIFVNHNNVLSSNLRNENFTVGLLQLHASP